MMFLLTLALVGAGIVFLVIGLMTGSSTALLGAAGCSALAILILWRMVGKRREKTFVSNPPPEVTAPDWHQPLPRDERMVLTPEDEDDQYRDQLRKSRELPPVPIEQYADLLQSEILPTLETLSLDELEAVVRREQRGLGRSAIISRAETLIDLTRNGPLESRVRTVAPPELTVAPEITVEPEPEIITPPAPVEQQVQPLESSPRPRKRSASRQATEGRERGPERADRPRRERDPDRPRKPLTPEQREARARKRAAAERRRAAEGLSPEAEAPRPRRRRPPEGPTLQ